MRLGPADRDLELSRVSRLTRWLVAGAVALAGVLTAVVAEALPGHSASSAPSSSGAVPLVPSTTPGSAGAPGSNTSPGGVEPTGGGSTLTPSPPPVATRHRGVTRSGGS